MRQVPLTTTARNHLPVVTSVAIGLLLAWSAALWATRATPAAGYATSTGHNVLAVCGALSSLWRARRHVGPERRLWRGIGVGTLAWGLTNAVGGWEGWSKTLTSSATPSTGLLVLYCTSVVMAGVTFAPLLWASNTTGGLVRDTLDSALITAVFASITWYLVLAPQPATGSVGPLPALLAAVLLGEIFIVVIALHAVARTRGHYPGLPWVGAGLLCLLVADLASAATGRRQAGDLADWGWTAAMLCLVISAGCSHMHKRPRIDEQTLLSGTLLPSVAALLALASSILAALTGTNAGVVDGWLQVAVLGLLGLKALVLLRESHHLTRRLGQRVMDRTSALVSAERRFASLVVHSADIVAVVDADGVFTYISPACEAVLGRGSDQLIGRSAYAVFDHAGSSTLRRAVHVPKTAGDHRVRTSAVHADGRAVALETTVTNLLKDPAVRGVVLNVRDVTNAVHLEEELRRQAFNDILTGLPNRALFRDRLEQTLRARGGHDQVIVMYLDLDGFKAVNDTWGHGAGDELLVTVAHRLCSVTHAGDTVARLGGDEFAVLLQETAPLEDAERLARRICEVVRQPMRVRGVELRVAVSIGLASTHQAAPDAETLMRSADLAMYRAKAAGLGGYAVYHPHMHAQLREQVLLEADLRQAAVQGQFRVLYQPLVNMDSGEILGVEALVRWHHPQRGVVGPADFIPL